MSNHEFLYNLNHVFYTNLHFIVYTIAVYETNNGEDSNNENKPICVLSPGMFLFYFCFINDIFQSVMNPNNNIDDNNPMVTNNCNYAKDHQLLPHLFSKLILIVSMH